MAMMYGIQYSGENGAGLGALYVGNGVMAGFDIYGNRFGGTYKESNGRLAARMTLTLHSGSVSVTGHRHSAGLDVEMLADWPSDLGNGKPLQMNVGGKTVQVHLVKMVDVP